MPHLFALHLVSELQQIGRAATQTRCGAVAHEDEAPSEAGRVSLATAAPPLHLRRASAAPSSPSSNEFILRSSMRKGVGQPAIKDEEEVVIADAIRQSVEGDQFCRPIDDLHRLTLAASRSMRSAKREQIEKKDKGINEEGSTKRPAL